MAEAATQTQGTAKAERKTATYRIEIAAEDAQEITTNREAFGPSFEGDRLLLGEGIGYNREQALADLLDDGPETPRLKAVREALDKGETFVFYVTSVSMIGAVPVSTQVKRERKIGR